MIPWLLALPRWVRYTALGLGAVLLLWLIVALWLHFHDKAVVEDHERELSEQLRAQETEAADAASEAASQSKSKVEIENEKAKSAASGSSDPLGDGLRSLRPPTRPTPSPAR